MFGMSEKSAKIVDTFLLAAAASDEAERLGHTEVDTDHLLLGLIAVGGPAADLLRRHGVTLHRARQAVTEVQRRDLDAVGIEVPDTSVEPPVRYTSDVKPLTPAAADIAYADVSDGPAVLGRLLVNSEGPAAQLVAHLGIELDASDLAAPGTPQRARRPVGAWQSTCSVVAPVPRDRIWALLDDPNRRPSWDSDVEGVLVIDDEHVVTCQSPFKEDSRLAKLIAKGGVDTEVHHHLTAREPGHVIAWREHFYKRGHIEHLRIELEDDPAGTRMTLSHRDERRGDGLGNRLLRWMSASRLRLRAQAITQAAS